MTVSLTLPSTGVGSSDPWEVVDLTRRRRAKHGSLWRDSLEASAWLVSVALVAFFLASGAMVWTAPTDALNSVGRLLGIIATVLMLLLVLVASRAPFIEGALGHDRALKLHGAIGGPVFYLLIAHAALIAVGYGAPVGRDLVEQTSWFLDNSRDIALSIVALTIMLVVGLTSITAVRRRWPYESWHAIHLFTYIAVGLAVPHMFTMGTTFVFNQVAAAFLAGLFVFAFGSMLVWRFAVPTWRAIHHRLVVLDVTPEADGSASITVVGRRLGEWKASAGHFFLVRFWTPDLWLSAHPYALSAVPDGQSLRFTVKPIGDDSRRTVRVRPGTRVSASGPYGRFTHDARVKRGLVLIGAGVGVTPLRAMLEDREAATGPCDVVIRGSAPDAVPLLDEFQKFAAERGAGLHLVFGHRGNGWSSHDGPQSLAQIIPDIKDRDVFVCGAEGWAKAVVRDARACGVAKEAIHVEEDRW